jgi:hypothetical protein
MNNRNERPKKRNLSTTADLKILLPATETLAIVKRLEDEKSEKKEN